MSHAPSSLYGCRLCGTADGPCENSKPPPPCCAIIAMAGPGVQPCHTRKPRSLYASGTRCEATRLLPRSAGDEPRAGKAGASRQANDQQGVGKLSRTLRRHHTRSPCTPPCQRQSCECLSAQLIRTWELTLSSACRPPARLAAPHAVPPPLQPSRSSDPSQAHPPPAYCRQPR